MKNSINYTINIILLYSFLLLSCEETKISELTNIENDIVVYCILSPFLNEITVFITETENAIGVVYLSKNEQYFERIRKTTVQMSSENNIINIPFNTFDSDIGVFTLDAALFPIITGKTYYLNIKLNNEKEITSQVTIPDVINSKSISASYGNVFERFVIQWQDPQESRDFYTIRAQGKFFDEHNNISRTIGDISFSTRYLSDQSANETDRMLTIVSYPYSSDEEKFLGVNVSIVTLSIDYYEHLRILENSERFFDIELFDFSNPAPIALPTNINGGVGIFGAYNITRNEIDF